MSEHQDEFYKQFAQPDHYVDFDYSTINGAFIYGDSIRALKLMSFLGIRVTGIADYNAYNEDVNESLDSHGITIVVIPVECMREDFDIEAARQYATSVNKILFIYGLDDGPEFLNTVNIARLENPQFC